MNDTEIAMQVRCIHCGQEQYGPNVHTVSYGEGACAKCGKMSYKMTQSQYLILLNEVKNKQQNDQNHLPI